MAKIEQMDTLVMNLGMGYKFMRVYSVISFGVESYHVFNFTDEEVYTGTQYRLRAGAPMPIGGGFMLHTFMAEETTVDMLIFTEEIVGSEEFRGQGGTLLSAAYNRLPDVGGKSFSGKIVRDLKYVDEK